MRALSASCLLAHNLKRAAGTHVGWGAPAVTQLPLPFTTCAPRVLGWVLFSALMAVLMRLWLARLCLVGISTLRVARGELSGGAKLASAKHRARTRALSPHWQ